MAVSKRLRYEVLRRDNHACRYCGRSAPEAKLTVDHVVPVALGGRDEPGNLVAACADCNAGKASAVPDAAVVKDVADDAVRWALARQEAERQLLADVEGLSAERRAFRSTWDLWSVTSGGTVPLPAGWERTVDHLVSAGLSQAILTDCIDIAMNNSKVAAGDTFRYMCGVAWKRVARLRELTEEAMIARGQADPSPLVSEPPLMEMANALVEDVVWAAGGNKDAVSLATAALWDSVESGAKAFAKAIDDGEDPTEDAAAIAMDEASSARAYYVYHLGRTLKGDA